MQFIAGELLIYCLLTFDYKVLFVCVKDKACLRIAILACSFNIFGSVFGVFFGLVNKKLISGSKTI